MIRKVEMYQCVCDGCGKAYEDEDRGFAHGLMKVMQ